VKKYTTKKEEGELPELKNLKREIKEINAKEIGGIIKRTFKIDKEILFKKKKGNIYRNLYMYGLKRFSQMKLKEIRELFGINYSTVTMNTNSLINKSKKDSNVRSILLKFEEKMRSKIEN
jgi:DNA-binding MarR family transcriptional regulator